MENEFQSWPEQASPGSHFQLQIKEIDPPTFSFQQL